MEDQIRNAVISVGTTPVEVTPTLIQGQRTAITLVNTSTGGQTISIQMGEQGSITGAGIILYPAGSWSESLDSAFIPTGLAIWAVASAAGGVLAIQDRIKQKV